jgi:hypothetical protein
MIRRRRIPDEVREKIRKYAARTGNTYAKIATHFKISRYAAWSVINKNQHLQKPRKVYLRVKPNNEPIICKHYRCGRTLTRVEKLYGDRCIHHSKRNPEEYY